MSLGALKRLLRKHRLPAAERPEERQPIRLRAVLHVGNKLGAQSSSFRQTWLVSV